MAAGAEGGSSGGGENGGSSGGGENGRESNPFAELAGSPLAAVGAGADAGAQGPRESIRHLNRCFGQAQPSPLPIGRSDRRQDDAASLSAADPLVAAACPAQRISLEAEIPEALFDGMRAFIQARPDWDQYSLVTSALAGFLFQHGWAGGCVSEHYLNSLFRDEAA